MTFHLHPQIGGNRVIGELDFTTQRAKPPLQAYFSRSARRKLDLTERSPKRMEDRGLPQLKLDIGKASISQTSPDLMQTTVFTRNRPGVEAPVVETEIMPTEEAAAYLKLSPAFLEMARHRGDGTGPPYCKLPSAVRYRRSQLDEWLTKNDHPGNRPIKSESVAA